MFLAVEDFDSKFVLVLFVDTVVIVMDIAAYCFPTIMSLFVTALVVLVATILVLLLKWLSSKNCGRFKLTGRHVLITGGSSGIGLATAVEAARRGARVTIVARDEQRLQAAAVQIRLYGSKCNTVSASRVGNVTDNDEKVASGDAPSVQAGGILKSCVKAISADITAKFDDVVKAVLLAEDNNGPIDMLINCAGISIPKTFDDLTIDEIDRMMRVNYFGAVMLTKLIVPKMKKRCEG